MTEQGTEISLLQFKAYFIGYGSENGIYQLYDMDKFFDKESLIDTLHTKGHNSDKYY